MTGEELGIFCGGLHAACVSLNRAGSPLYCICCSDLALNALSRDHILSYLAFRYRAVN